MPKTSPAAPRNPYNANSNRNLKRMKPYGQKSLDCAAPSHLYRTVSGGPEPSRAIDYLEYEEIDSILKAIDRTTLQGARDYALLATMFNTGGRAQEIVDLRVRDLQLIKPFQVRLFGKGKKERYCPLWPETAAVLKSFCKQRKIGLSPEAHLFLNHRDQPLSRFGGSAHSLPMPGRRL